MPTLHSTPAFVRRLLIGLLIALGALAAFVLIGETSGWPWLRGPVERQLARTSGAPVRLDAPFRLRLIGAPGVSVGHLRVGGLSEVPVPFLVDAQQVSIGWRWRDVWAFHRGAPLTIAHLHAQRFEAHLVRSRDGDASWLPRHRDETATRSEPPRLAEVRLEEGVLHVDDAMLDLQFDATFRLDDRLMATAPAREGDTPTGFAIDAQGRYRGAPATASVRAPRVLPLVSGSEPAVPLQTAVRVRFGATRLAFDGTLVDLLGSRRLAGTASASGPTLSDLDALGLTLPDTPAYALRAQVDRPDAIWRLRIDEGRIGSSRLGGEFRFDPRGRVPHLGGTLRGERLALRDLGPSIGAPAGEGQAAPGAPKPPPGRVLPRKAFDIPSLGRMNADVTVDLAQLDLGTEALAPLQPLKARIVLQDRVLAIEDLDGRTPSGRVSGRTVLDGRTDTPRWMADLALDDVDLASWIRGTRVSGAGPAPRTAAGAAREREASREGGKVKSALTGRLSATARVQGEGRDAARILATLDGEASAAVKEGAISHLAVELAGIDLAQGLGVWVRGDDSLPLSCAVAAVRFQRGVATLREARFDTRDSTIAVGGTVDLRDERLDLRAVVRPHDFTPLALRAPLHIAGRLGDPDVTVDKGKLLGRAAAAAALALVHPAAALAALVDPGRPDGPGPCPDAASPASPASPAKPS